MLKDRSWFTAIGFAGVCASLITLGLGFLSLLDPTVEGANIGAGLLIMAGFYLMLPISLSLLLVGIIIDIIKSLSRPKAKR
jgi:hypothetical protein